MNLEPKHILSKRRIGTYKGAPIVEMVSRGGLYVISGKENGKSTVFGIGPHQAIARFVATKNTPELKFSELSKSEPVPEATLESVSAPYFEMTRRANEMV
jgi:hypothetical protein